MNKKSILLLIITIVLSSCSLTKRTTTFKEEPIVIKETKNIIVNKAKEKDSSINSCKTAKDLQTYFKSIDYEKKIGSEDLILKDIPVGMFDIYDAQEKKKLFFKVMYPIALKVNEEIAKEREDLLNGKNLESLMKKYKTTDLEQLKLRVDVIPIPMFLAQAAIESAYGASRFAEEGNALFGQWTTSKTGMSPSEKPDSKWKVARFKTLLDSARAYALNINTNRTYSYLRYLRSRGQDAAYGLSRYSQKGKEYIDIIHSVIRKNNLNKYN